MVAIGVPPATTCNGKPRWRARPCGFQYRDRDGASRGVTRITLKAVDPLPPLTGRLVRTDDPATCSSSRAATFRSGAASRRVRVPA